LHTNPGAQSELVAQLATHLPASQREPLAQSVSLAQLVRQPEVGSHPYGPHACFFGVAHVPRPSHVAAVRYPSAAQVAGEHVVSLPFANMLQVETCSGKPSHCCVLHGSPPPSGQGARAPFGFPVQGTHLPELPATSHAAHCASHALSQQTPSAQKPEPHSAALLHSAPRTLAQVPGSLPAAHEVPASHVATPQHTPSVQKPTLHAASSVHLAPRPSPAVHTPALHEYPATQSAFTAHSVLHSFESHT
jgi:hypothetical protein